MIARMKAARIIAPRRMTIEEVPVPSPGEGEVRIEIEGCGVCASNLGPWLGLPWMKYPLLAGDTGHEVWGVVDAVGPGVRWPAMGRRVTGLSYKGYAQYDVARAEHLIELPDALAGRPFPGEPIACAMNIFERSDVRPGQTVAIVGIGFLGAILTRLCRDAGARPIAISRRPFALALAEKMGAAAALGLDDPELVRTFERLTGGRLADRSIEATGKQRALDVASQLTGERGRLIVAGYHQDGPRQVNMQMWNWRGIDVINAHERDPAVYLDGMRRGLDAVLERRIDLAPLLTHSYPLSRLDEALEATAGRPHGFVKAVVVP